MQTKTKTNFKAIPFTRQVRDELSTMIQTDNKRFHEELEQSMADFMAKRQKINGQHK